MRIIPGGRSEAFGLAGKRRRTREAISQDGKEYRESKMTPACAMLTARGVPEAREPWNHDENAAGMTAGSTAIGRVVVGGQSREYP